jgi:molybdopterin-guanine dinucleotide biosynthesis protein A
MTDITLAIVAGGAGTRMGFPKQQLEIACKPILAYLADRFEWPGPSLLVTTPGRERPAGADRFDREAVDAVENQGPLRGVLTALEHVTTESVVIATVDMPGLQSSQLIWLVDQLIAQPNLHGLMLQRNIGSQTQIEPFPFACHRSAAPIIAERLNSGNRSIHSLASMPGFAVETAPVDWPAAAWTNLNFPEDLRAFLRSLQA